MSTTPNTAPTSRGSKVTAEQIDNFSAYLNHPDEPSRLKVVDLLAEGELTLAEIAQETGLALSTVKVIKSRAVAVGMLDPAGLRKRGGSQGRAEKKRAREEAAEAAEAQQDATGEVEADVTEQPSAATQASPDLPVPYPTPHRENPRYPTPQEHSDLLTARSQVDTLKAALRKAEARIEDLEADNASLEIDLEDAKEAAARRGEGAPSAPISGLEGCGERVRDLEALLEDERRGSDKIAGERDAWRERAEAAESALVLANLRDEARTEEIAAWRADRDAWQEHALGAERALKEERAMQAAPKSPQGGGSGDGGATVSTQEALRLAMEAMADGAAMEAILSTVVCAGDRDEGRAILRRIMRRVSTLAR